MDDLVLIGFRPPGMKGDLHLDHWLAGGLTRPTPGLLFDVDPRGLSRQAAGSSLFQDRYLVLGRPEEAARRLMSPALESQMLDWTELPSAPLGPQVAVAASGVVARLRMGRVAADEPAVLERLTAIGAAAAAALRRDVSRRG